MRRTVYILLPVHNRRELTRKFIECLRCQSYQNYHLVLIDDGSTDGTEEMAKEMIAELTVIKGNGDWWWAGALEQGYRWLKENANSYDDVVLIINDDAFIEVDFIEKGIDVIERNPKTLLLAECYSQSDGRLLEKGICADWSRLRFYPARFKEEVNCLSTMGLFMRVGDFIKLGGFYPRLLPHFTSDYEFTMRARRKGFKLMTDPSLKLWIREDTTWNKANDCEFFSGFLRTLFSKRSPNNPIVWTFFIALACPWRWKLINWYRVWAGTAYQILSRAFMPGRK